MKELRESLQEKKSREYSDRVTPGNRRHAKARKDEKTNLKREARSKGGELLATIKPQVSAEDAEILAGELTATHLRKSVTRKRPQESSAVPLSQVIEWQLERRIESFGRKRRNHPKYDKMAREAVETLNSVPKGSFADVARRAGKICNPENRYKYENELLLIDPLDRALYFLRRVSAHSHDENQALCRNKNLDSSLSTWIAKANRVLAKDRLGAQTKMDRQKALKTTLRAPAR
jgi:hypothetical protein